MRKIAVSLTTLLAVIGVACVTINVYFPEAAAVEAADRIINEVRGEGTEDASSFLSPATSSDQSVLLAFANGISSFLISDAEAQDPGDFDKTSPETRALESSLKARFPSLRPFFNSGAIGPADSGLVEFRDRKLVPLKDRNKVVQLVAAQNNDWNALYKEIAKLNNHPEWQDSIRSTFAKRSVTNADRGWYYRQGGVWKQK